uniref:Uncharacterized protein n=1 Tax=Arundo donax TaxID=35708 RepID=A0A0A8XMS4_ARUDO
MNTLLVKKKYNQCKMNKLAYRGRRSGSFDSFTKILILFQITSSRRNHHQPYS